MKKVRAAKAMVEVSDGPKRLILLIVAIVFTISWAVQVDKDHKDRPMATTAVKK